MAEAYGAMDDLRDAEDEEEYLAAMQEWEHNMSAQEEELEYLEAWKQRLDDSEEAAAMGLKASRSEFEEHLAEREVVQDLSLPRSSEVVKYLTDEDGKVVQNLIGANKRNNLAAADGADSGESLRLQNEAFCSEFEARQAAQLRAHTAIAGGTRFRVIESHKNANPGAPLAQDLDF